MTESIKRARFNRCLWPYRSLSAFILAGLIVVLTGCAASPPRQPNNVCAIFSEKSGWYKAARKAKKKWGVPVNVSMAFVHRESSYVADAKPP